MKYCLFGIAFILICLVPSVTKADVTIQIGPAVFHFPGGVGEEHYDDGRFERPLTRQYRQRRRVPRNKLRRPRNFDRQWENQKYAGPNRPKKIFLRSRFPKRSIFISTKNRKLYFIINRQEAIVYPVAVGKDGFAWRGREKVTAIKHWPDWFPPAEMRARKPELPEKVSGGVQNPLGAAAIYLGNTLYRIHGTNEPNKIGTAVSSGCIRMHNEHVRDLINRIKIGTVVIVR